MHKILFLLLFFIVFSYSKELPLDIFATKVESKDSKIVAYGDVILVYDGYYIEANRAIYDKKNSIIELFGKISILKDSLYTILSNYAIFDMKNRKIYSKPFFFIEHETGVWISSNEAIKKDEKIALKSALVSSCEPDNPDWKIEFTSGNYDNKTKWVTLYNARLYAKNTPIFYTPFFRFSTSKERKSGLLIPDFAYSKDEGFTYIQPIYLALEPQWDLELDPQIRTKRGSGFYATFRFVDTPFSNGYFRVGSFKEKSRYAKEKNLKNDKHHGYEIFYTRDALFTKVGEKSRKDGLYIDFKYLNDVDYFNLQKSESTKNYGSLVISRLNYYFNKYDHYFGFYAKYFIDTSKIDNDDTLQILPKLQYHQYSKSFLLDNILYSVDFKYSNYYRKIDTNAISYELNVPIGIYFSFFDDYIGFLASENIYANYIDYSNTPRYIENGYFIRNYHKLSIYSDLLKDYENFLHTIHLEASLFIPSYEKDKGEKEDFITINSETKRLEISLKEFFYNMDGDEFLYHRVIQPIFYEKDYKYGNLENEIGYNINKNLKIVNDIFYSHKFNTIISMTTSLRYSDAMQSAIVSHFYKNGVEGEKDSSYISASFSRNLSKKYKLFGKIDYDFKKSYLRSWEFGYRFNKRCWNYRLSYKEDVRPILTSAGSASIKNRTIMFKIELVPLGGFEYAFKKEDEIPE